MILGRRTADPNGDRVTIDIHFGENLDFMRTMPSEKVNLIYIDPPFNTGRNQRLTSLKTVRDEGGDRVGFGGNRYKTSVISSASFADTFDDFLGFLEPSLIECHRVLAEDGSLFLHLDPREAHYAKVLLDQLFGRDCFMNEIIWSYDFGGRSKRKWPAKHDTILWYAKDPKRYTYNFDAIDRIPYMAPGLVTPEKAALGKIPTDVWWQTIVPTNGKERTGYPTQKPIQILNRIVRVHSNPGDLVADFFAGSGTTGEAAALNERDCILIDNNEEAIQVMAKRLSSWLPAFHGNPTPEPDT
jgi:site-specific DNA-methyltransferase (adenine-specific)